VSLAQLESALAPVERYAVRFIEVEAPQLDRDGLAAKVGAVDGCGSQTASPRT
jgi:hypothetical protein